MKIVVFFLILSLSTFAQTESFITDKINLNYLGLSEPAGNITNRPATGSTREKIGDDQEGRRKNQIKNPSLLTKEADPVVQRSLPTLQAAVNHQLTIEGRDFSNASLNPPDVNGVVGCSYHQRFWLTSKGLQ